MPCAYKRSLGDIINGKRRRTFRTQTATRSTPGADSCSTIRIDPSCKYCTASEIEIKSGERALGFTSNASFEKESLLFFNASDPQIYVQLQETLTEPIEIKMQVSVLDEATAATIEEQHATIENLNAVVTDFKLHLQNQIQQADAVIQSKQRELAGIYASRSWKITKPLRVVGKILRKIGL